MNTRETTNMNCPVCGKAQVGEYDICPVCNWENDPIQLEHPEFGGGANHMALEEARAAYQKGKTIQ